MANIIEIDNYLSPELDIFARLTESQLRSRLDESKAVFIAESPKVIRLALDNGYCPAALLMPRKHLYGQGKELIDRCGDIPVYTANDDILQALTGYQLTRGILCAFHRPLNNCLEKVLHDARRVAVLENITDATNVGAIVRSAAALNMDAVLFTPSCCDPLNRRAVRVSMGTIFQIPWAWLGSEQSDWPKKGIDRLHEFSFKTAAMALSNKSVSIDDERLAKEEKLAIVLGTEGDGLCPQTIANCDYTVKIPMAHGVDSLNVAAAGALAFWELRVK